VTSRPGSPCPQRTAAAAYPQKTAPHRSGEVLSRPVIEAQKVWSWPSRYGQVPSIRAGRSGGKQRGLSAQAEMKLPTVAGRAIRRAWGKHHLLLRPGALVRPHGASGLLLDRRVRRASRASPASAHVLGAAEEGEHQAARQTRSGARRRGQH